MRFTHLMSGIDDESLSGTCGAALASLTGFTEWVSEDVPQLSLGWDWMYATRVGAAGLVRFGLPRSNLLIASGAQAFTWEQSLDVLAGLIDALPWKAATFHAICDGPR